MKRFFFSLIALSAVAVGCTQSALLETPDLLGTEIQFNPYTGRTPVTKATEIKTAQTLGSQGFNILGYLTKGTETSFYMNGLVKGYTSDDNTTWDYQGSTAYWPDISTASTTTLSFVGYSANAVSQIDNPNNTEFTFSVNPTVAQQVDFLATKYQTKLSLESNPSGIVDLDFIHLLSRVGFKLKANRDNENIKVTINRLELCGSMPTDGTLNLLAAEDASDNDADNDVIPVLEPGDRSAEPVTYSLLTSSKTLPSSVTPTQITNPDVDANNCYMMIIPHTSTDDKIVVEYFITSADGHSSGVNVAEVPLTDNFEFAAGHAYEFVLQVSTSSIGFTVEETDWNVQNKEQQIDPQPADPIDVGASVKGTTEASVAVDVNVDKYKEIYVEYKMAGNDGTVSDVWADATSQKIDYPGNEIGGPYIYALTGLTPNTYYQYRIKGVPTSGAAEYTEPKTFITLAVISTNDASEITSFGAYIQAVWSNTNGSADLKEVGFCWIEGNEDPTTRLFVGKEYKTVTVEDFEHVITTLNPQKTYRFRPYVINKAGGVSYGPVKEFTTTIALETPDAGDGDDEGGQPGGQPGGGNEDKPIDPWEGEGDGEIPFE